MLTVSVVIPVYHGETTLAELYRQLSVAMKNITSVFEIIFVDDGSADGSWAIISRWRAQIIACARFGCAATTASTMRYCAERAAKHDVIVTMDDDLQHPVSEIAPLLAALGPDQDVVYGAPLTEQHGLLRDFASRLTKIALASAMERRDCAHVSAFRTFRTHLRDGFQDYRSPSVSIDVLLTWTTTRFAAIKVRHAPRATGSSGYTVGMLIRHAVNLITGFSTLPLQIASIMGFSFVVVGFLILVVVTVNYFIRGSAVPGFAFVASSIAVFSGAQLFALGVLGEYLARIHFRTMGRPVYVVGETVASCDPERTAEQPGPD